MLLIAVVSLAAWGLWRLSRRGGWKCTVASVVGALLLIVGINELQAVYHYVALYYRYSTLDIVELKELPTTDNERIQPFNSIFTLAHEVMTEAESPMRPDFVRVGDQYRWTMAIEPAYSVGRLTGEVRELLNVSATSPSPNLGNSSREEVHFPVGEGMLLGHQSDTAVRKSFGLWRFLNYETEGITYLRDDKDQWVQVVPLIRWKGLLFPRPEFGGVQVIEQSPEGLWPELRVLLFGAGRWIRPDQIEAHPWLAGQDLLPPTVSRYMAHSFRFQNGFLAPLPGYHMGDIRIPDLPEDVNDQPFTTFFRLPGQTAGELFQYFALEPFDPNKQGLNTSILVPADGRGAVCVYRHHEISGSLTGVSAISAKVMESRKQYDWSLNRPVEHRPFIRHLAGQTRFFWMTTVVTKKEGESRFIAGSLPEIVITDAAYNIPVWVNPLKPESWTQEIESHLTPVWSNQSR